MAEVGGAYKADSEGGVMDISVPMRAIARGIIQLRMRGMLERQRSVRRVMPIGQHGGR